MFAGSRSASPRAVRQVRGCSRRLGSQRLHQLRPRNHFFTCPRASCARALWLQSDMLGYMLDGVDAVTLANQQGRGANERRQTTENRPMAWPTRRCTQRSLPRGHLPRGDHWLARRHPVHRAVDVRLCAHLPANNTRHPGAGGRLHSPKPRRLVTTCFGPLRAGPKPPEVQVPQPVIQSERRLVDRIELPRAHAGLAHPAYAAAGDAELDVVSHVLGGSKASRLTASWCGEASHRTCRWCTAQRLGSLFSVEVIARPAPSSTSRPWSMPGSPASPPNRRPRSRSGHARLWSNRTAAHGERSRPWPTSSASTTRWPATQALRPGSGPLPQHHAPAGECNRRALAAGRASLTRAWRSC